MIPSALSTRVPAQAPAPSAILRPVDRALRDPVEQALAPLDRLRVWILRASMPVSSVLAGQRESRVAALGLAVVLVALGLSLLAPPLGPRLILLFCFAQSVHYGVWLRLVPEDDRGRPTPRSYRASYRALVEELGAWALGLFAVAALGLAIWACVDLAEARDGYLRFARFHGSLELIAAGLLIVTGRRGAQVRAA